MAAAPATKPEAKTPEGLDLYARFAFAGKYLQRPTVVSSNIGLD